MNIVDGYDIQEWRDRALVAEGDLQVRRAEVGIMMAQRDSDALMIHSLKALISQAQWSGRGRDPAGWYCPWCLSEGTQGHADGCPAVDVLGIGGGSF